MPTWSAILLAVVAPGGVLVALIEKMRRENNRDHGRNAHMLRQIDSKVDKIDGRLDSHIDWHAHKD